MRQDLVRQLAVAGAVVGNIASGLTQDFAGAQRDPALVLPARWAFAIWGPVYAGALAYVVDQARPDRSADPVLRRTGWPLALAFAASGTWIRLDRRPGAQLAAIAASAASSAWLYRNAREQPGDGRRGGLDRWTVRMPVGLYTGWVAVASLVGATETLRRVRPRGVDPDSRGWALGVVATGTTVGLLARRRPLAPSFPAALAWGLAAVAVQVRGRDRTVCAVAAAGAGLVTASAVVPSS